MNTGYVTFKLPYTVKRKRDRYVSYTPLLDLYSQGKTKKEAIENLTDAIKLFLTSCIERDVLFQVMTDCGATLKKTIKQTPPKRKDFIDIPISLTSPLHRECHA